jgi:hypothetical protein
MIDPDAGEHRAIRLDDIDRIEATAQADFENRCFDSCFGEPIERGEGAELEVGKGDSAPCGLDTRERFAKRIVGRLRAGDAHALVVAQKVRRGIEPRAVAGGAQDGLQHRAGRALAVGAADSDDRTVELDSQSGVDLRHALQPERDGFRMLLLDVAQPFVERLHLP